MRLFLVVIISLCIIPFVVADTFHIQSGTDDVELNESLGSVVGVLDAAKLPTFLKDGLLSTTKESVSYKQFIRFSSSPSLTAPKVVYMESSKGSFGDFLLLADDQNITGTFFEYELDFGSGLTSAVSDKKLVTLDNKRLEILGESYTLLDASFDGASLTLKLAAADQEVTLKEGEVGHFSLGGASFTVEVVAVANTVSLKVNNRLLNGLSEGDAEDVDNVVVAVANIFSGQGDGDAVTLLVNASVLTLKDDVVTDDSFFQGFSLNGRSLPEGWVKLVASLQGADLRITKVMYRAAPLAKSSDDVFVASGSGVAAFLKNRGSLLSSLWDIRYNGLSSVAKSKIRIGPGTSKRFDLSFVNKNSDSYKIPLVSSDGSFHLGDESHRLYFIEGSSSSNYLIEIGDYAVVTTANTIAGVTSVVQYDSINTDQKMIYFSDLSGDSYSAGYTVDSNSSGSGTVVIAGKSHNFYVENISSGGNASTIALDLNGDNDVGSDEMNIVVKGGGLLDLGDSNTPGSGVTLTLTTLAAQFDESAANEVITIPVTVTSSVLGMGNITGTALEARGKRSEGVSLYGVHTVVMNDDVPSVEFDYPASQLLGLVDVVTTAKTVVLPSCTDSIRNQDELGVDCGGSCAAVCAVNASANVSVVENVSIAVNVSSCSGCDSGGTCYAVGTNVGDQY